MTVKNAQCCVASPRQLRHVSPEVGGNAEDHNQHGVVDVEAVGDEGEHAHRAHDLQGRERRSRRARRASKTLHSEVPGKGDSRRCRRSAPSAGGRWPSPCGSDPGSSDTGEASDDRTTCRSSTTRRWLFFTLNSFNLLIYWKKCWSGDTEKVFFGRDPLQVCFAYMPLNWRL